MFDSYRLCGHRTRWSLLQEVQAQRSDQVIILEDFDQAVLHNLQDDELKSLQGLARTTARILWVTTGGFLSGRKPEHAMVSGLARCLRSESVSVDLVTLDIDSSSTTVEQTTETVTMFADRQAKADITSNAE